MPDQASDQVTGGRRCSSTGLSAPGSRLCGVRLIHTSDWHLGRSFHQVGLLDAQAAYLDHLVEVVRSERVDAVLVAATSTTGRCRPPTPSTLLSEAVARLVDAGRPGGAVQRQPRLGHPARLRVASCSSAPGCTCAPRLADVGAPGAASATPPVLPAALPRAGPGRADAAGRRRAHPRRRAAAPRWSGCAPTWRRGAARPRSSWPTRSSPAGRPASPSATSASAGSARCHPDVFAGRRLRRPGPPARAASRSATGVRYSGSPVALSFSEADHTKGVLARRPRPAAPPASTPSRRRSRGPCAVLRGTLERAARRPAPTAAPRRPGARSPSPTRSGRSGAMERVRRRFPHTLVLRFDPQGAHGRRCAPTPRGSASATDLDVCCDFLEHVRGGARRQRATSGRVLAEAVEAVRVGRAMRDDEGQADGPSADGGRRAPREAAPARGRRRSGRSPRTEEVDFDALSAAGLFLIHGAHRRGQDQRARRHLLRPLRRRARRARREPPVAAQRPRRRRMPCREVALELTAGGRRLRITRSPEFAAAQEARHRHAPGAGQGGARGARARRWVPLSTRNDEAADGRSRTSSAWAWSSSPRWCCSPRATSRRSCGPAPSERREVLERLFDIPAFSDIEQWLADRAARCRRRRGDARAELEVALVRVQDVLVGLPASAAAAGAPVADVAVARRSPARQQAASGPAGPT